MKEKRSLKGDADGLIFDVDYFFVNLNLGVLRRWFTLFVDKVNAVVVVFVESKRY
jgi:hypothetical protein